MNAMVPVPTSNVEVYRASTDAAGLCREIVLQTAMEIQNRKYVKVEGWQAIAIAHGCTASARDVERVEGGVRAIGEIRRMSDGAVIAEAEGFVGEDEATWYGGTVRAWRWGERRGEKVWYDKELPKRPDYAIRAMAQTRAISRACRSAFAHVVVLIDANLSTTPAEEVPMGGFDNDHEPPADPRNVTPEKPAKGQHGNTAGVAAAKVAIDLCMSEDDIKAWWPANQEALDAMSDPEFDEVKNHYEARWAVIRKGAAKKAARRQEPAAEEIFA
jgi:hypothetical protein